MRNPEARRMEAKVAAVEPLPFVPAISTAGETTLWIIKRAQQVHSVSRSNLCDGVWASSWPRACIRAIAVSYDIKWTFVGRQSLVVSQILG